MSPVKYKLGFYIPEDTILHSHHRENFISYMVIMFQKKKLQIPRYTASAKYEYTDVAGKAHAFVIPAAERR
jgi:hypothetical protein